MSPERPLVPLSSPSWLSPPRVAAVALALGVATLLPPLLSVVVPADRWGGPTGAGPVSIAFIVLPLAALVSLARARAKDAYRSAAALVAVATFWASWVSARVDARLFGGAAPTWALALHVALTLLPFALALGTLAALVARALIRARARPSHDALEPVLLASAVWVIACASLAAKLAAHGVHVLPWALGPLLLGSVLAALGLAGAVAVRDLSRYVWIGLVRDAKAAGWSIAPRGPTTPDLAPWTAFERDPDGVLSYTDDAGSAFRGAPVVLPVALAGVAERGVRARFLLRALAALALSAAVVAATAVVIAPVRW